MSGRWSDVSRFTPRRTRPQPATQANEEPDGPGWARKSQERPNERTDDDPAIRNRPGVAGNEPERRGQNSDGGGDSATASQRCTSAVEWKRSDQSTWRRLMWAQLACSTRGGARARAWAIRDGASEGAWRCT